MDSIYHLKLFAMLFDPIIPTPEPTAISYSQAVQIVNKTSDTLIALSNIGPVAALVLFFASIFIISLCTFAYIVFVARPRANRPPVVPTPEHDTLTTELVRMGSNLIAYNKAQDERAESAETRYQKMYQTQGDKWIESITAFTGGFHTIDDSITALRALYERQDIATVATNARITAIEKSLEIVTADGSPAVKDIRKVVYEVQEQIEPVAKALDEDKAFKERIENTLKEVLAILKEKKRKTDELPPVSKIIESPEVKASEA
jgi:hypothetical protein